MPVHSRAAHAVAAATRATGPPRSAAETAAVAEAPAGVERPDPKGTPGPCLRRRDPPFNPVPLPMPSTMFCELSPPSAAATELMVPSVCLISSPVSLASTSLMPPRPFLISPGELGVIFFAFCRACLRRRPSFCRPLASSCLCAPDL